MSVDSDSASASSSRDWYFPSPPFIQSSNLPKYPRRFPENPRFSRPPFRDVSSSSSAPQRPFHNAGPRRRVGFSRRTEHPPTRTDKSDAVLARKSEISSSVVAEKASATTKSKLLGFLGQGLEFRIRWKMAITVAVSSLFLSLYICIYIVL